MEPRRTRSKFENKYLIWWIGNSENVDIILIYVFFMLLLLLLFIATIVIGLGDFWKFLGKFSYKSYPKKLGNIWKRSIYLNADVDIIFRNIWIAVVWTSLYANPGCLQMETFCITKVGTGLSTMFLKSIGMVWAWVAVKWSACYPSTPTIWVRILIQCTIFCVIRR